MSKYLACIGLIITALQSQYLITNPDSLLNNGTDYLIITHHNFTDKLYPLCRLRDSLGLQVKMVEVNLVYSTFPDTSMPWSIRHFLERVYYNWNPRPTYILLVGDAERGGGSNDFIPSPLFPKFNYYYWGGLTEHAADNWYVTLEGEDSIPDMIIARLPVNSPEMTEGLINKIINYEHSDTTGSWTKTVLVNSSVSYQSLTDSFINVFLYPAGDSVIKIYASQGNIPPLRQRHIDAINQGTVMILPLCSGTIPHCWLDVFDTLFHYADIPSLHNQFYPICFCIG